MEKKMNIIKNNRIIFMLILLVTMIVSISQFSFIHAQEEKADDKKSEINQIMDIQEKTDLFKFSDSRDILLPFLRMSYDKVEIDKDVLHMGLTYGNKGVEVNSKTQDLQVLISNDTVRINNNMEYAVIISRGNVIIDSNIDKSLIIFAGEKVTLTENANIGKDVVCFSNLLEVKGTVDGNVVGGINSAVISGKINKDFRINTESIDISDSNNILGNVFIETRNENINLKDKYPNSIIKIITNESTTNNNVLNIIIGTIKTALVYSLAYLIIFKVSKKNIFNDFYKVVNKNIGFSFMSGALAYVAIPLVVVVSIFGVFIGIDEIAIPFMVFYLAILFVLSSLCIFILGTIIHEYLLDKYLLNADLAKRIVCVFFVFLSLILLTNIPKVGLYINMIYMIIAVGATLAYILKKKEAQKPKKKK